MKLNKKNIVKIFYIVILFILYNFLLEKFDYTIRYLTNFIFIKALIYKTSLNAAFKSILPS